MNKLEISGIEKRYGDLGAINGVDLTVKEGELLAVLGPSGCGKSTLLSIIAGITEADAGRIVLDGELMSDSAVRGFVSPEKRNIGFVFQNYALWPHMNVEKNIAYPLKIRKRKRAVIELEVDRILSLMRLEHKRSSFPGQLSGGEQQRVALGRALIMNPGLLLLDEPLSSLDAGLRVEMQAEIRSIQKELGLTVIHVTHDQAEAMAMADRIAVMNRGRLEQIGEPSIIYEQPATAFTADFMGTNNLIKGFIDVSGGRRIFRNGGTISLGIPEGAEAANGAGLCIIRPEDIEINPSHDSPCLGAFEAVIESRIYRGAHFLYKIRACAEELKVQTHSSEIFDTGSSVYCVVRRCRFLPEH
ncbi:MAG: ABC transporter ATP-binding protein [Spirochaetales bacterium]|nr:ABC transporter ATP-binding protein [Spirochaetales bacterium]